jgi:hypothetical protein
MTHPHGSAGERDQLGPSADGTVMLDIGPGRGALVVQAPAVMAGAEIEIAGTDPGSPRTHMAIRERIGPGGSRYAAIFPSLPPGQYALFDADGWPGPVVTISEGRVTEVAW